MIDVNWVELEQCPSPLSVPIISPHGIELSKSLKFRELPLSDKIDVFSALCDYRLWCEDASDLLKDYPMEELRLESIGKDSQGYEYWYFSGTRLFRENIEVSQDLICRKKRIKELEYKLIELGKVRILKEQEEKKKAELERAKQLANEAREARLAAKRQQQEQEATTSLSATKRKRGCNTPVLPPRTGLRERRSSAAGNNNESPATPSRTLRSRAKPPDPSTEEASSQRAQKVTRNGARNSKQAPKEKTQPTTPEGPKKSPEEECREELETIAIKQEERNEAWSIACESLEEWENFTKKFEKTKSTNEKYLSKHLVEHLLPHIQGIYAKKAAEIRRKEKEIMLSLTARRVSTRIISKRAQEEEEERQAQLREIEIQKKKTEAETRLRAELEREMRAKRNRFVVNGDPCTTQSEDVDNTAGRYNLRQPQNDTHDNASEFDGIIHPDKLAEFYEALELIVDTVRTSKHAWPFVDAVPDTVPGYYDLIKEPMDLKTLRTKVEFRHYKSLIELEKDFQLLVNNCEKFNGPKNVYTKMVYKLWKSFRKNVQLYLERDLHMNEHETFLYPPPPPAQPPASMQPPSSNDVSHSDMMCQNGNGSSDQVALESTQNDQYKQESSTNGDINPIMSNGVKSEEDSDVKAMIVETDLNTETKPSLIPSDDFFEDNHKPDLNLTNTILPSNFHDSQPPILKKELTLQFQPTPIEVPVEIFEEGSEFPPEPVCEEVIVESYVEPSADDISVVFQPVGTELNQSTDK